MIRIEKVIPGGQGLATLEDGKKAFFWNALPGEVIEEYQVTKNKSHYIEGVATKISNNSKHRVEPRDDCYLSTSPWQIIDYDYELKLKPELVVEIFREHHIDINTPEIYTDGKDYYYRNKMEYALYWDHDTEKIHLALHQRGSHRKIPIVSSSIERPEIFQRATEIINRLNSNHEEARKYQSLLLRCNQNGEVSGGLYENHRPHQQFPPLTDEILGHTYTYSPNGFFQINLPVYEQTLQVIKSHIATDKVLDLYSGVGTIGLSVARDHCLTSVECDKYAYSELVKNCAEGVFEGGPEPSKARSSATTPVATEVVDAPPKNSPRTILAKSEEVVSYIEPDQTVILDPPRAGCDKRLIDKLIEIIPEKIIYLSCNPATQARDVALLLEKYHIDEIKTFNFFPHTPHIENLVILSRKY